MQRMELLSTKKWFVLFEDGTWESFPTTLTKRELEARVSAYVDLGFSVGIVKELRMLYVGSIAWLEVLGRGT